MDWNDQKHPMAQTEPRWGERAVLAATVICPEGPLLCYCLHMEVSMPSNLPDNVCTAYVKLAICRLNTDVLLAGVLWHAGTSGAVCRCAAGQQGAGCKGIALHASAIIAACHDATMPPDNTSAAI